MIQDVKMLETDGWDAYALLDSGEGRKLERYGSVIVDRPDAQAIWKRTNPELWDDAQAIFSADKDEEGDEEGENDHAGDCHRQQNQPPSHGVSAVGSTSLTPTPLRVWR